MQDLDDSCTTDDQGKDPTHLTMSTNFTRRLAQPTPLYVLRQQLPWHSLTKWACLMLQKVLI